MEEGYRAKPNTNGANKRVRLHKKGMPINDIAAALSMGHVTVRGAIKAAATDGLRALAPKPTGRPVGSQRRLTSMQELHIQRLICKHRPEQLKLEFALWNRGAVTLLVKQEFGIDLPIRTMGEYLKRWGFTPQKPITRAYEQRPEAVKKWLDEEYPAIAEKPRRKMPRFTGAMKRQWSIPTYVAGAISPKGRPHWPTLQAVSATSCQ
jgi:transposase